MYYIACYNVIVVEYKHQRSNIAANLAQMAHPDVGFFYPDDRVVVGVGVIVVVVVIGVVIISLLLLASLLLPVL